MKVRRPGVAVCAAAVIVAAWASASGEAGTVPVPGGCDGVHAKTLLRSNGVRVYKIPSGATYGCIESSGITQKLSPLHTDDKYPYFLGKPFATNAPWVVGLSRHERIDPRFGPVGESLAVTARNIALGSVTSTCHINASKRDVYPTIVKQIVIARNGTVAWSGTEEIGGPNGPMNTRVVRVCIYNRSPTGKDGGVARGDQIDFASIAVRGKTLEWMEAGTRCSVQLKGPAEQLESDAVCE